MENNQLTGTVYFGGQARGYANVLIYEVSTDRLARVGSTATAGDGTFSCIPSSSTTDGVFYALAYPIGGNEVLLATIIGPAIQGSIVINELTTVAAAFSMAQFINNITIWGDDFGLRIAWGMNDNLVNVRTGAPSEVLNNSPNGDETNSLRSTRALANLLAACAQQQSGATDTLLALTTPPYGTAPLNTFQALANITLNPANNVADIYTQSKVLELYTPALERQPDAWTLAVKVNVAGFDQSGDPVPFGGPANLVFDQNGYAWVANNVFQGTPNSGNYIVALKPNGMPADGLDSMPKSPVTGGGILGPGFGIDIDRNGNIWVGNFGWGGAEYQPSPEGSGSVSQLNANGQPISGDEGYQGGTYRVQGMAVDRKNNIWFASYENNSVVVFPNGDATHPLPPFSESDRSRPFGIAIARDGSAWVTNSGGLWEGSLSSLSKYAIQDGQLVPQFPTFEVGHALKGLAVDSLGNAWVASGGDNAVYLFSPEGEQLGTFGGGGINAPWGATLDGDDNVWVANFGPMTPGNVFTTSAVSKLAGSNPETRPHGLKTGDPISPQCGYTLPTGGSEVLLPNGQGLYGAGGSKCFNPLMRMTNCVIDQAGNVWAMNNWKPDISVDFGGNPGGDGIVIFVGLARPPKKKH
jgi:hypothetical protein